MGKDYRNNKKMKGARKVELSSEKPLSEKEYEELLRHCVNSMSYWAEAGKTLNEAYQKMLEKGYIEEAVEVLKEGESEGEWRDLLSEALETVEKSRVFHDEDLLTRLVAEDYSRAGKSPRELRLKLQRRLFRESSIKKALEEFYREDLALERALPLAERKFLREEDKKREFLVRSYLVQKGFNYRLVDEALEERRADEVSD